MPEYDPFDAPQGGTIYGGAFVSITEAFGGNGIEDPGDAELTSGSGNFDVDVAGATGILYGDTKYAPSSTTLTVSSPPTSNTNQVDDRRVDLIYFDSTSGSYAIADGTPSPNPEPPAVPTGGLLLGLVEVDHEANAVTGDDILDWRAPSDGLEAEEAGTGIGLFDTLNIEGDVTVGQADGTLTVTFQQIPDTHTGISDDGTETVADTDDINFASNIDVADDGDATVTVSATHPSVSDGGSEVVTSAEDLNFGANTKVVDDGDGTVTVSAGKPQNVFSGAETGTVAAGDQGVLIADRLADTESVEVFKVVLTTTTVQAVPSNVDLELVTFDNAGAFNSIATLATGDGSTIHDRITGNPITTYTNTTGASQSIGVIVDNGSGSPVDVVAKIEGKAPA
jgi:hypothetical protein